MKVAEGVSALHWCRWGMASGGFQTVAFSVRASGRDTSPPGRAARLRSIRTEADLTSATGRGAKGKTDHDPTVQDDDAINGNFRSILTHGTDPHFLNSCTSASLRRRRRKLRARQVARLVRVGLGKTVAAATAHSRRSEDYCRPCRACECRGARRHHPMRLIRSLRSRS